MNKNDLDWIPLNWVAYTIVATFVGVCLLGIVRLMI